MTEIIKGKNLLSFHWRHATERLAIESLAYPHAAKEGSIDKRTRFFDLIAFLNAKEIDLMTDFFYHGMTHEDIANKNGWAQASYVSRKIKDVVNKLRYAHGSRYFGTIRFNNGSKR